MSTLADLQTRIIEETNRDDLGDVLLNRLQQAIVDAISEYQDERFWFNEQRVTSSLAVGQQYATLPSGSVLIDKLYAVVGSVEFELRKRSLDYIESLYQVPQTGQPIDYAVFAGQVRLWPTPAVTYPAVWLMIGQVAPAISLPNPVLTTSNNWTNEAQWLICARAKQLLYRNVFKDYEAAAAAGQDVAEAYAKVKGYTNQNLATGRIVPAW